MTRPRRMARRRVRHARRARRDLHARGVGGARVAREARALVDVRRDPIGERAKGERRSAAHGGREGRVAPDLRRGGGEKSPARVVEDAEPQIRELGVDDCRFLRQGRPDERLVVRALRLLGRVPPRRGPRREGRRDDLVGRAVVVAPQRGAQIEGAIARGARVSEGAPVIDDGDLRRRREDRRGRWATARPRGQRDSRHGDRTRPPRPGARARVPSWRRADIRSDTPPCARPQRGTVDPGARPRAPRVARRSRLPPTALQPATLVCTMSPSSSLAGELRDCRADASEGGGGRAVRRGRGAGRGGMGVVYTAYDPELDRKVALKLLSPRPGARTTSALVREAQAMARLSHPNVVAVYDVGTDGERVFVAMELVEGGTLREWLRRAAAPWREIARRCSSRPGAGSRRRTRRGSCTATSSRTTCSSAPTGARA